MKHELELGWTLLYIDAKRPEPTKYFYQLMTVTLAEHCIKIMVEFATVASI